MDLPSVLENDFQDIQVNKSKPLPPCPSTYMINTGRSKSIPSFSKVSSPSPLKRVTRLSLVSSESSQSSNSLIVNLNKFPANLTPLQRLSLHKQQLNNSITSITYSQTSDVLNSSLLLHDDEEIDSNTSIYNVPLSQPLHSINYREKFVFANQDRKSSLTTASTRASSILSHDSFNDTSLSISDVANHMAANNSFPNINFANLQISKDAHELTLLFNQNEFNQIQEESRQRRQLLNDFKKVNSSNHSISIPPKLRSASLPNLPLKPLPPKPSQRSTSSTLISTSPDVSSKYHSFTRPTWLPPKSQQDKSKHQRESELVIQQALLKEAQENSKKVKLLERIKRQKSKDIKKWQMLLDMDITDYRNKVDPPNISKLVLEMYWRGIDEEIRSKIWWKQYLIKNKNSQFDEQFCDHYFDLYDASISPNYKLLEQLMTENHRIKLSLEQYERNISIRNSKYAKYNQSIYEDLQKQEKESTRNIKQFLSIKVNDDNITLADVNDVLNKITSDLLDTYPDMNYFQNYESIQKLTRIIFSFVLFLSDSMKMQGATSISDYYFPGLNNIVAVFYYTYRNSYKTLVTMCQFVSHRLPTLLLTHRIMMKTQTDADPNELAVLSKSIVETSIDDFFVKKFDKCFKQNHNRLYSHFKVIGLKPIDYLPDLILSLFSNVFNLDLTCHIIDIFVFEVDNTDIFIKVILGLFKQINHKLFGSKSEIINLLGEKNKEVLNGQVHDKSDIYRYLNIGYEYEFIDAVKAVKV